MFLNKRLPVEHKLVANDCHFIGLQYTLNVYNCIEMRTELIDRHIRTI